MNSDEIKNSLEKLGYTPKDFGDHWRMKALYRGGSNPSSIKVYKNSGVWHDHGQGGVPMPLVKLAELTLQTKDPKVLSEYAPTNQSPEERYVPKETVDMEKTYPKECLNRLFPNYSFYNKRGISEATQKLYQCGLAGNGQMYQRIVFPIYNSNGEIVGFSGRKINDDNAAPKWKHIGTRNKWVYPAFVPQEKTVDTLIEEKKEVILVESIGDSLALTDEGYGNNLVTFGLDCSPALLNYLCSKELDKIIIAPNNDEGKPRNHGKISAMKNYMKLCQFFDLERLSVQLPWENDFGEMKQKGTSFKEWHQPPQASLGQKLHDYKEFCLANRNCFQEKKLQKFLKKIDDLGFSD